MRGEAFITGLDFVADVLIPPSASWPAPSTLSVGADLAGRLREREIQLLTAALEFLEPLADFADAPSDERVRRVADLESKEPAVFDVLRRCVYYGYYAQPAVIRILREQGYDINESPQPKGYRMDPFNPNVVEKVDRRRVVWIPVERVGQTIRTAS